MSNDPNGDAGSKEQAPAADPVTASDPSRNRAARVVDEQRLFQADSDSRLFGEGDSEEIGSRERAHHAPAGLGSFSDAGGFGGTELLGEEEEEQSPSGPESAE